MHRSAFGGKGIVVVLLSSTEVTVAPGWPADSRGMQRASPGAVGSSMLSTLHLSPREACAAAEAAPAASA